MKPMITTQKRLQGPSLRITVLQEKKKKIIIKWRLDLQALRKDKTRALKQSMQLQQQEPNRANTLLSKPASFGSSHNKLSTGASHFQK